MAQHEWLSFDQGIADQAAVVDAATETLIDWFEAGGSDALIGRSVVIAGIGASHAAAATPVYALRSAGIQAYRSSCSDIPDDAAALVDDVTPLADVYVAVSQGGRSRETIQALLTVPVERRVAIVNDADSPLADTAGTVIGLGDLVDSHMSSIGFSATVVALGLMVDRLAGRTTHQGWRGLATAAAAVVDSADEQLRAFGAEIALRGTVDVVSRAADLTAAEQGALLFREGPGLPAMAMDTRSYLHGPMDCAGPATSHVLFGGAREGLLADQLAEKDVPILLVSDEEVDASATVIRIPSLPPTQRVLVEVALLQRLVQHTAAAAGKDVEARAFTRYDTKVDSVQQVLDGTV